VRKTIDSFFGEYRFLSNFYPAKFIDEDRMGWTTVEHYYQAMKTEDEGWRKKIRECEKPGQAKRMGNKAPLRENWDYIKCNVMWEGLFYKFSQNEDIRDKLLDTEDSILIEGNKWGDTYWGQVDGQGTNMLGVLLMILREEI